MRPSKKRRFSALRIASVPENFESTKSSSIGRDFGPKSFGNFTVSPSSFSKVSGRSARTNAPRRTSILLMKAVNSRWSSCTPTTLVPRAAGAERLRPQARTAPPRRAGPGQSAATDLSFCGFGQLSPLRRAGFPLRRGRSVRFAGAEVDERSEERRVGHEGQGLALPQLDKEQEASQSMRDW